MARYQKIPDTGIEGIFGLPGSGKSLYAVTRIRQAILQLRRPVYTNLPLKFPVMRKYLELKGDDKRYASYIRIFRKEHFDAFIARLEALNQYKLTGQHINGFFEKHGKHVAYGEGANWIPIGSIIVVDEAHKFWPQSEQSSEGPLLRNYLTMHRHMLHWIWVLTQTPMQVSHTWRKLLIRYVECVDRSRLPVFWNIKFPIPVFAYAEYHGALSDNSGMSKPEPSDSWVDTPWLDGGLSWRFYRSFEHAGSYRKLLAELEKTRQEVESQPLEQVCQFQQKFR